MNPEVRRAASQVAVDGSPGDAESTQEIPASVVDAWVKALLSPQRIRLGGEQMPDPAAMHLHHWMKARANAAQVEQDSNSTPSPVSSAPETEA